MILVQLGIISINIKGVTTLVGDSAIDDGAFLLKLLLNHRCPIGIVIECGTSTVGTGFLDGTYRALVVSKEQEGIGDVAHTVGIHTTTTCRCSTILHALGLAYIAHQRSHGSALLFVIRCVVRNTILGIVPAIGIEHVVPIEGNSRQCRNSHRCSITPPAGVHHTAVTWHNRCLIDGVFPIMEHHRRRGCWAACVTLIAANDTLVPIGCILVPQGSKQWFHSGSTAHFSDIVRPVHLEAWVTEEVVNLLLISFEPSLHVRGHAVDIERSVAHG